MQALLDQSGLDTALARRLLDQGHLDVQTLQALLAEVRTSRPEGATLARSLLSMGLVPQPVLEDVLATLETRGWKVGARVDDYRLLSRLGAGGMGVVFLAEHTQTRGRYALKTLPASSDADLLERFRREAEAQAKVDAHPNVVRVHSFGQAFGHLYLVMDHAEGGDLDGQLRIGPFEDPRQTARIVRDLARGLAHVHAAGVLHRDLKPANVLFDDQETPKLVDFGLARATWEGGDLTKSGDLMGTPAYMAPEQARAERDVDERTDVYGLGAIFYECLTGKPPFKESSVLATLAEVCVGRLEPPRKIRPELPAALESICLRAMAREPSERYASAADLADDLDRFLAGDSVEGLAAKPILPLVTAGVIVLAAVLAAVLWPTSKPVAAPPPIRTPVDDPPPPPPPPPPSASAVAEIRQLLRLDAPQRKQAIQRLESEEGKRLSPEQRDELREKITALLKETESRRTGLPGAMVEVDLHQALAALDPDHFAGDRLKVWLSRSPQGVWARPEYEEFVRGMLFAQPGSLEIRYYTESFRGEKEHMALTKRLEALGPKASKHARDVQELERQLATLRAQVEDRVPYLWRVLPRLRPAAFAALSPEPGAGLDDHEKTAGFVLSSLLDRLRRDMHFLLDREGLERLVKVVEARREALHPVRYQNLMANTHSSICHTLTEDLRETGENGQSRLRAELQATARRGLAFWPQSFRLLGYVLSGTGFDDPQARRAPRRFFLAACAGTDLDGEVGLLHWESVAKEELVVSLEGDEADRAAAAKVLWPLPRGSGELESSPVLGHAPMDGEGNRPLAVHPGILVRIVQLVARHRPQALEEGIAHLEWSYDGKKGWSGETSQVVPTLRATLSRGSEPIQRHLRRLAGKLPLDYQDREGR